MLRDTFEKRVQAAAHAGEPNSNESTIIISVFQQQLPVS